MLERSVKCTVLYLTGKYLVNGLILGSVTSGATAADFAPWMEFSFFGHGLSNRQLLIRRMLSVHWIWAAYYFLTFCHCLVSILVVSLIGCDRPEQWNGEQLLKEDECFFVMNALKSHIAIAVHVIAERRITCQVKKTRFCI
ncbi:hypothetical protein QBC44DRAFT_118610 [Cladorrhinum sp. PSN332]|nr:hypothetical protein QBC44DRAFT_118610 [Cladorrhinum sp. PSN332]